MNTKELYARFDELFDATICPYIERRMPRDRYSLPIYHYIDQFQLRRFRSGLPLLIARALAIPQESVLPIAAASELIFYGALVHDDILDRDERRGTIPAAHIRFGSEVALASADLAYAVAAGMVSEVCETGIADEAALEIGRGFVDAQQRLYRSFLFELLRAFDSSVTRDEVRRLHLDKTVQGINALACTGIVVDNARTGRFSTFLRKYAELLAVAGQIKNDIYDVSRYAALRGYSDFRNGYINYLLCELFHREPDARELWIEAMKGGRYTELVTHLNELGIMDGATRAVAELVDEAIAEVSRMKLPAEIEDILVTWALGNREQSFPAKGAALSHAARKLDLEGGMP